jgi:hypothetical protein
MNRPVFLILLVAVAALASGCRSYTAYMQLEPRPPATSALDDREKERAIAIVEAVTLEHGFIRNPRLVRLQRQAARSVESNFDIVSSFVPGRALTGNRLSISAIVYRSSKEFAVLIHDRDAAQASSIVNAVQKDLSSAFAERFPRRDIAIKRERWAPAIGL